MPPELVILFGLQGAGKSTFYRSTFQAKHDWVSKDRFRNNRNPARRQRQLIEETLQAARSVVADNTNPTVEERAEVIALGRTFEASVVGYYFVAQQCPFARSPFDKLVTAREEVYPVADPEVASWLGMARVAVSPGG